MAEKQEQQENTKREPRPYKQLASEGPYGPGIGSALITMVEPHPGHEHSYNRWYEDDYPYHQWVL